MSSLTSFQAVAAAWLRAALAAGLLTPIASGAEETPAPAPGGTAPRRGPSATQRPPEPVPPAARPPVRLYTNADLERVHPFAAQTGGSSLPAVVPRAAEAAGDRSGSARRGHGEAYWRREAERVRERLRALEERAAGLRARIAERERERARAVYGRRGGSREAGSVDALNAALAALERRIQLTQDDLDERARRDGALPGWLR